MTETQRRIKAYKEALPDLRERVIAVALLLVMSATMLTSVSFAWVTLSRNPEVAGASTTVAANGNLEIALASADGSQPKESAVGDSSASKNIADANRTWGNLVNLSDESYGLNELTLRPAQLNLTSLLTSPLYGAEYDKDGRITRLTSEYSYTAWNMPQGDTPGFFGLTTSYGVRAISSVETQVVGGQETIARLRDNAQTANLMAGSSYVGMTNNKDYMNTLATLMGLYMTARMDNDGSLDNPNVEISDLTNLRDMYSQFLEAFQKEAEAIAELINMQLYLSYGDDYKEKAFTAEKVYSTSAYQLRALSAPDKDEIKINKIDQFIKDWKTIESDSKLLDSLCQGGTSLKWKDSKIGEIVNRLVNVGLCTIGEGDNKIIIDNLTVSSAMGYLSGTQEARITNGVLYNFEERVGSYFDVKSLSIKATVKRKGITVPASVKANIKTTAPRDTNLFTTDRLYAESFLEGGFVGGTQVAQDTYGMAVDLYVRTNAADSYLTLEGNLLSETKQEQATTRTADGQTVNVYIMSYTITDGTESYPYTQDVYTTDEQQTWYSADTHTQVTPPEGVTPTYTLKTVEVTTILGYEGENRIWEDKAGLLSTDATTQGSGSCYVYYADNPEDQAQSMRLLSALKIAFVDAEGRLLTTALLDTENVWAENGRVIVPMVLDSGSVNAGTDENGQTIYGITSLEQNTATRITAIVYLDGTRLSNEDVLAASDIQGQLNIQFGSSVNMEPIKNEELESKELTVSASVDKTEFDWMTDTNFTTNVTLDISGSEPQKVTAFFLRQISATQGSRETEMTFVKGENGKWIAPYTFQSPGTYVLRTVQLDGVEYVLQNTPSVTVKGFEIKSLTCSAGANFSIMSADNSYTVDLEMEFATENPDKLPKSVQGRFFSENGSVNVDFRSAGGGKWKGSATFLRSDTYVLENLVLDGEYNPVPSSLRVTANVTLGMQVRVYTTSPQSFKYTPTQWTEEEAAVRQNLQMQVWIYDNAGNEMQALSGAKLFYNMRGSGITTLDADLHWNGSYYVGSMASQGPGIWEFQKVTVGENTLTYASSAPVFTIQSPEPPAYVRHDTLANQYAPNGGAKMNVTLSHASSASVAAKITNGAADQWVEGKTGATTGSNTQFTFEVPNSNGAQDGNWQLTDLKVWGVFDQDGNSFDSMENAMEFDLREKNIRTKVVSKVNVTFPEGLSRTFGKDGDTITGTFLQNHTLSGMQVTFTDFEGQPVTGIQDVKLTFTYVNGSSQANGGYSSGDLTNATANATVTVSLTDSGDGKTFTQSGNATFLYAGNYETTMSYRVGDGQMTTLSGNTLPANAPKIQVYSKTPTVKITGISSNKTTDRYVFTSSPTDRDRDYVDMGAVGVYNWKSDNGDRATVYMYTVAKDGLLDQEAVTILYPEVTLSVEGLPQDHQGATMVFKNATNPSKNNEFTFAAKSATATGQVGAGENGTYGSTSISKYPVFYPIGKQTVSQMTVSANGLTFTVNLSNSVTINQPQYPPYVDFAISDTTYTGSVPARVYSQDGETVKMPEIAAWIQNKAESASLPSDLSGLTPISTKTEKIAKKTGSGSIGRSQYTKYDITTKIYEVNTESTVYSITKRVTVWNIDGKKYQPGQTVTLSGGKTANAVITDTHNNDQRVETGTMVRTVTTCVNSGTYTDWWAPSGYTENNSFDPNTVNPDTGWQKKS